METTGHIWIKDEVEGTTSLQKEFNNYLDQFHSIIAYAAQVYGFYHEIDKMTDNLGSFSDQLSAHPGNALAVALSSNRNKIYRDIIIDYNAREGADKMSVTRKCMERWKRNGRR